LQEQRWTPVHHNFSEPSLSCAPERDVSLCQLISQVRHMKAAFHYTRFQSTCISLEELSSHLTVNTTSLLQIQMELGCVFCAQCGVSVRCHSAHCAHRYVSLRTSCLHLSCLHCHFKNIFYLIETFAAEIFKTLDGLFVHKIDEM